MHYYVMYCNVNFLSLLLVILSLLLQLLGGITNSSRNNSRDINITIMILKRMSIYIYCYMTTTLVLFISFLINTMKLYQSIFLSLGLVGFVGLVLGSILQDCWFHPG